MFEELSPALEAVLAQGHPGVVIALVGACRRVGAHQAQVLQLLLEVMLPPTCLCPPFKFLSLVVVSLVSEGLIPEEFTDMEQNEAKPIF